MAILSNKKFLWGIIILLIVLNLLSLGAIWRTQARKPVFDLKSNISKQNHFLNRRLNFTSVQQESFDSLITIHRQNMKNIMKEIGALRKHIIDSMQDNNNILYIDSLVRQIGSRQVALEQLNYSHFKQVLEICDQDQKEKFIHMLDRAMMPDRRFDRSNRFKKGIGQERFRPDDNK